MYKHKGGVDVSKYVRDLTRIVECKQTGTARKDRNNPQVAKSAKK